MVWLEIIYDLDAKRIIRWTKSEDGSTSTLTLKAGEGRKFVSVPEAPVNLINVIENDLASQDIKMKFKVASHWARVVAPQVGEKPLRVKRTFEGEKYVFNCYVSEDLAQLYADGNLQVGDYVLVTFIDGDIKKPLAVTKIKKTW